MSETTFTHTVGERRHLYAVTALIQAENPPRTIWQTCLIRETNREAACNYGRASLIAGLVGAHKLKPSQISYKHITVVPCESRHLPRLEPSNENPLIVEIV